MNKGFTLIEIIIATGIIMSLAGFGTASYLDFNDTQILDQAGKTLVNNLRKAQGKAFVGEKDTSNTVCQNYQLDGWCVSRKDDDTYRIYGHCGGEGPTPEPTQGVFRQEEFNLPSGVKLNVYYEGVQQDNERLLFGALSQGADKEITYCLDNTDLPSLENKIYTVVVKQGGEIIDNGVISGTCP